MPLVPVLETISGEVRAAPHNSNYANLRQTVNDYVVFKDLAATIEAVHTYSARPVYNAGLTVAASGLTVTAGGLTVTAGGLLVSAGGFAVTGNSTITGDLAVSGTITGTLGINVSAANITAGTFPGASYTFGQALTVTNTLTASASIVIGANIRNLTNTATVNGTVNFTNGPLRNVEYILDGDTTLNLSNDATQWSAYVRVRQNGTGGWTLGWSGAATPNNGSYPTQTATAGRADVYLLLGDGAGRVIVTRISENVA